MLGGGVFVNHSKMIPGSYINLESQNIDQMNAMDNSPNNIAKLQKEVIEARSGMPNLNERLDKMEIAIESVANFATFRIDENGKFVIESPDSVWDISFEVNENGEMEVTY